jgi:hypothetical protein
MNLLCKIGLHNWKHTAAEYATPQMQYLAVPDKPATRECKSCGKAQVRDEHCLGFNPPEYAYHWYATPKGETTP